MNAHAPDPLHLSTTCRAIALLVNGENIAAEHAGRLIVTARERLGPLAMLRVYGDAAHQRDWAAAPGFRFVQARVGGKSVSDMLLAVEAMELALTGKVDGIAIASNDRDFGPLVWTLKGHGIPVLGLTTLSGGLLRNIAPVVATALVVTPPVQDSVPKVAPAKPVAQPPKPPAPLPAKPATEAERRLHAIRAVLKTPQSPAAFGKAMKDAGFDRPAKSAPWQSWLSVNAPFVVITGSGQEARFALK